MCGEHNMHERDAKVECLKGRYYLEYTGINRRITLKWISNK
jgi:hypothetical protein